MTQRVALGLRYDGTRYHGWQTQAGLITVQQQVELALSRIANHPIHVVCAGRTDAGVHATAQVLHFDTEAERTEHTWISGVNRYLPKDIAVTWAKQVSNDFHARYSAESRSYQYVLYNSSLRPALFDRAVGWCYRPLDIDLMQQGANYLIGEHDFSSFRGADCQAAHAVRCVQNIEVMRENAWIFVYIRANAFLLHMVRNIVAALVEVGSQRRQPEWVKQALEARDRCEAAGMMEPNGLYLIGVEYPSYYQLPQNNQAIPFF